jgi:nicotinamidase-related amidase
MFLKEKENSRSSLLLDANDSQLLIIDVQEKFAASIPLFHEVVARSTLLARAAQRLGVPVRVTEQYPKGLGPTVSELLTALDDPTQPVVKSCFSAGDCASLVQDLRAERRRQYLLCGVEAHVCVLQTACDLLANLDGQVYVVRDAVASRRERDRDAAFERLAQAGAQLITVEMAIFEWLRDAGHEAFKEIQGWVK